MDFILAFKAVKAFIKKYWLPILIGVFLAFTHYKVYGYGQANVQAKWDAANFKQLVADTKAHDERQKFSDDLALAASARLDELNRKNRDLQKRLQNEIAKNSVYHSCVVPANGVRLYNENAIQAPGR